MEANTKLRCFRTLRKVSSEYGVLPKSYYLDKAILKYTYSGRLTDVERVQFDGRQVCIKAFRTQAGPNLEKIRRVCNIVPKKR